MGYMKLLIVFLTITLLTVTASNRHRKQKQHFEDSVESDENESDERPGNGHRQARNHRGRGGGGYHNNQGGMRGNVEFNGGLPEGYPIKGPAQQPFILPANNGRGKGPHRYGEQQNNFPQQNQNFQGPQQKPQNNYQQPQNNYPRPPVPPNYNQQSANNFNQPQNNFQGPNPNNPFLPPIGQNQQPPIQPSLPGENIYPPQTVPYPYANKQNPPVFEPVTNEFPTTLKPLTTTPSYANPRRTDLLYGSNLLEEDQKRDGKSSDNPDISFDERGLFDSAPHCQPGQILVNNRCRLQV